MQEACLPDIFLQTRSSEFQRKQWSLHSHQLKARYSRHDGRKLSTWRVICIKDEAGRLANQEASLPIYLHEARSGLAMRIKFMDVEYTPRVKCQASAYDILPLTTAIIDYALSLRKLSADRQFFLGAQMAVRL